MIVLGMMSGTSLDGLDLALCQFTSSPTGKISYKILCADTVRYSDELKNTLRDAPQLSGRALTALHCQYAAFCAEEALSFIRQSNIVPALIASHGHTVFHRPAEGYTLQIGSGAVLAAHTGITTVCDFRTGDVALGGQGAPLVPVGDRLLFDEYDACLNLGGIANVSFANGKAMDICFFNMEMNLLARAVGLEYDAGGHLARQGSINTELQTALNAYHYFRQAPPKSLGLEDFENHRLPVWQRYQHISPQDALATVAEHAAQQIHRALEGSAKKVLVTGGGAFNDFVIERMKTLAGTSYHYCLPDKETIEFKEALIFALLGYLRYNEQINCLQSVTGASRNSCAGAVYPGIKSTSMPVA